jgi:hypothetical protein
MRQIWEKNKLMPLNARNITLIFYILLNYYSITIYFENPKKN